MHGDDRDDRNAKQPQGYVTKHEILLSDIPAAHHHKCKPGGNVLVAMVAAALRGIPGCGKAKQERRRGGEPGSDRRLPRGIDSLQCTRVGVFDPLARRVWRKPRACRNHLCQIISVRRVK